MIWISEPQNFPETALEKLKGRFTVVLGDNIQISDKLEVSVIFCRLKTYWDAYQLDQYPNLKTLVSPTTGHNHIDIQACRNRNVRIVSLAGRTEFLRTIRATIEFTIFLTLSSLRLGHKIYRQDENNDWSRTGLMGSEISGKNILIIGYGRVGSEVAKILSAFGANVFYSDPNSYDQTYQKINHASDELSRFDITIVTASYNGNIIIDKNILGKFDSSSVLINTARAELIDCNDLYDHLKRNVFFRYVSDVFWNENNICRVQYTNFLDLHPQCLLTPHIAGYTTESLPKVEEYMVSELLDCHK